MKLGTRKGKKPTKDINALDRIRLTMAGCFDFRVRASSFDMHQLQTQRHKLAKISKMFRSRSEPSVKGSPGASPLVSPKGSPKDSPKCSPGASPGSAPRRRFMRVVRDSERRGEEYENPHVIRRYTQEYVSVLQKSLSLEDRPLPYTATGNTILKKYHSMESKEECLCSNSPPLSGKHASFKEEVEIIEYDKKGKIPSCALVTHREKLHDDSDDDFFLESDSDSSEISAKNAPNARETDADKCGIDAENDMLCGASDLSDSENPDQEQPSKKPKTLSQSVCTLHKSDDHKELTSEVILEEDTEALEDLHLPLMRAEP